MSCRPFGACKSLPLTIVLLQIFTCTKQFYEPIFWNENNFLIKLLSSYLDYSAYPVISPHNSSFPKDFNLGRLSNTYVKRQVSGASPFNKQDIYLNVSSPNAGYWYSASFVDSNDQMVKPDLLRSNCSFYLTASVSLWKINDTIIVSPNATVTSTPHAFFKIYKLVFLIFIHCWTINNSNIYHFFQDI